MIHIAEETKPDTPSKEKSAIDVRLFQAMAEKRNITLKLRKSRRSRKMEIRKVLQTDDFNVISRIYALSWKTAYKGILPQPYLDELSETRWSDILATSQWDSFVIIVDGKYIGTSSICKAREKSMHAWGEIISIYLLPDCFGKGYGKLLLDTAIFEFVKMGYSNIYLWVLEGNMRARAFYERNGFKPTSDKMPINIGGKDLIEIRYIYNI